MEQSYRLVILPKAVTPPFSIAKYGNQQLQDDLNFYFACWAASPSHCDGLHSILRKIPVGIQADNRRAYFMVYVFRYKKKKQNYMMSQRLFIPP